jgi:hypothetical protein
MVTSEDRDIHDNETIHDDEMEAREAEERRTLQRFTLRLQAILKELRDRESSVELFTRDISSDGAFLLTDSPLPLDSDVEVTLFLPAGEIRKSKIRVDGRVVRAEREGIAVRFDSRYSFTPV